MNNLFKNFKLNSFVIISGIIITATLIAYTVSVKREVEVNLSDFFILKARD